MNARRSAMSSFCCEVKDMSETGTGTAMQAIEYALRGLDLRNQVIANNVANAEVPGFLGSEVSFEENLRRALDRGDTADIKGPAVHGSDELPGINGNNVRLEVELTEMVRTNLLQQAMINAYNFKLDVIRTAIGSR